jgi:hypothetical protein
MEGRGYDIFKVTSAALSGDTEEKHKLPLKYSAADGISNWTLL